MARSITEAVRRIKADVAKYLDPDSIREACRAVGHTWRERILDPVTTVHVFLIQILNGNTACAHALRLAGVKCSLSAYCQGRGTLPLALCQRLLLQVSEQLRADCLDEGRWHGHRTFHIDGSGCSMPDTEELQKQFGQPGGQAPGCGFPVAHLLSLFHAGTGMLMEIVASALRTHDMSQVTRVHPQMSEGDVLVGDRAFASFVHLVLLSLQKLHGVFRVHQRQIVDFRPHRPHVDRKSRKKKGRTCKSKKSAKKRKQPTSRWIKRLGPRDQLVEYFKPRQRPDWMSAEDYAQLPDSIEVRELRYRLPKRGYRTREVTLVTTLLDPVLYPAEDLAELYHQRWQIETNFKHLKQTLHMDVLRCQTVRGVLKELTMYALVYNLVRLVMLAAAKRQGVAVERISFVDAARWLATAKPGDDLSDLIVNPARPGRSEPRVRKRRPKQYPYMKVPRGEWRKALKHKGSRT